MSSSSLLQSIRQTWLRRNTFFFATVFSTALISEIVIDGGVEKFWEWKNRGKLWKDLEARLNNPSESE